MGVTNQHLFLNGVFAAGDCSDELACALESRGRQSIASMAAALASLPRFELPLFPFAPMGIGHLRRMFRDGGVPPLTDPPAAGAGLMRFLYPS